MAREDQVSPQAKDKEKKFKNSSVQKSLGDYSTTNYTQDWTAYNQAQTREKLLFMVFLDDLLTYLPKEEKPKSRGRPPLPLRDKIFCLCLQQYTGLSGRRCISDLKLAKEKKYINQTPHFNSVFNYYNTQELINILKWLVEVASIPLASVEQDFAVDSSGFSTSNFERWLDVRIASKSKKRKYKKAHITSGVKTNIITAVNVTEGYWADSPQFEELVRITGKNFDVREVSADKAYSSKKNLQAVADIGAKPYILFKKNARTRSRGAPIWKHMLYEFKLNEEEFLAHYHKRSNVESTFSMIKRKLGYKLRSKNEVGQMNEILTKCLVHNICVLIQEMFELGIKIDFNKCAKTHYAQK